MQPVDQATLGQVAVDAGRQLRSFLSRIVRGSSRHVSQTVGGVAAPSSVGCGGWSGVWEGVCAGGRWALAGSCAPPCIHPASEPLPHQTQGSAPAAVQPGRAPDVPGEGGVGNLMGPEEETRAMIALQVSKRRAGRGGVGGGGA